MESAVIVHFDERGEINYHVYGDDRVRLFIVDERAPHDRVFEWTRRADPLSFREMLPEGSVIGHPRDERHEAIKARVIAADDGRPHLSPVEDS